MANKKSAKERPVKKKATKKKAAKKKPVKEASTSGVKKKKHAKKKSATQASVSKSEPVASAVDRMQLPSDLLAFLRNGPQLQYDAKACDAGKITLLSPDQLRVRLYPTDVDNGPLDNSSDPHHQEMGCYLVPGVSLLATCEHFDPDGLLLWLPNEQCYGTWDSSHTLLEAFSPDVTWTDLSQDLTKFINTFWGEDDERVGGLAPLVPWPKYDYDPTQPAWPLEVE